uniref:Uncharacterized protein n=1 Tax=Myotis myotis TaxID=51298 RepID=A0A7J7VIG3_MYOMY|nr:hypothetical protein mMyoMyo1_008390 [Myotis myotis]
MPVVQPSSVGRGTPAPHRGQNLPPPSLSVALGNRGPETARPGSRSPSEEVKIADLDFRFPAPQCQVRSLSVFLFFTFKRQAQAQPVSLAVECRPMNQEVMVQFPSGHMSGAGSIPSVRSVGGS